VSIKPFNFAATPHIHFGAGQRARLKELAGTFAQGGNNRLLLLTGGQSFDDSAMCQAL